MTVIYPDPLSSVAEYHQELARLEAEIASLEKQLGQLRRLRGYRLLELEKLQAH